MKNNLAILSLSLVFLQVIIYSVIIYSCKKEEIPALSTSPIANITATSATGGGNITSDGNASVTSRGVCWSPNANPTTSDSKTNDGTGAGQFVSSMTGLTAGSTYHVRAYATNSVGTAYGADLSFATLGNAPECLTQAAINITSSGATLNGTVNANYLSTIVTFEYGHTTTYGQTVTSAQSPVAGNSITNVSADISNLTPGTTYHFRVIGTNSIGTTNGNDMAFTTGSILPTLTTSPISNKTAHSATSGGYVTADGGSAVTAKGVCWAIHENPTISDDRTLDGTEIGSFTSEVKCLSFATTYYARAYAINSVGTAYGDQVSFTTLGTNPIIFNPALTYGSVTDIEGNCYKTIQIGDQTWMAENLRTTIYNDNAPIINGSDSATWCNDTLGAYCWYNNDALTYKDTYGALYNWDAVNKGKLCPTGWHVPLYSEWWVIINNNETWFMAGKYLKESGTTHWLENDELTTNQTGFTALGGGFRNCEGFSSINIIGRWWASSALTGYSVCGLETFNDRSVFWGLCGEWVKGIGFSVRCIKD